MKKDDTSSVEPVERLISLLRGETANSCSKCDFYRRSITKNNFQLEGRGEEKLKVPENLFFVNYRQYMGGR
jgi:hypothetical protein